MGLKAGIEIHQQIDTGKLFSRTPSFLRSDEPDYEVIRRLHKVAGETGEIDVAVEHEALLGKEFVYQGYNDSVSLVELDESPPREIDEEALDVVLQIALLLNCDIYSVSQIMRKTVIDGSNTSGFQRTVLIAHSGHLDCSFGNVGIQSVALEEDAARIIDRSKERVVYRLDRLGIPLVEITTSPSMKTPEDIMECALKLGEILRACKVRRGIGTIRQDVNVSIKGHDRVEIKGFQEPKIMIKTVDLEIERQLEDLKKKKKNGEVRSALKDGSTEFSRPLPGKARMYPETDLPLLRIGRDRINRLKKNLPKLKGEIKGELRKKGLSEELINLVLSSGVLDEFSVLMKVYDRDANLVGKMVSLWRSDFSKKSGKKIDEIREILSERVLEDVLVRVRDGDLDKSDVRDVLWDVLNGVKLEEAIKIEKAGDDEMEEKIRRIVKDNPGLRVGGYMGLVIKEFGGKLDSEGKESSDSKTSKEGKKVLDKKKAMEILKKIIG